MIGRDRERLILDQTFERTVSDHACQLFTVLGGAGVGKSRLVHEFVRDARERATILRGRCLLYGDGIPYWPIVEIVKQASGIGGTETPEDALARLDAAFGSGADGPRMVERIAQLMGLSEVPAWQGLTRFLP
jgi:predicted ATPase